MKSCTRFLVLILCCAAASTGALVAVPSVRAGEPSAASESAAPALNKWVNISDAIGPKAAAVQNNTPREGGGRRGGGVTGLAVDPSNGDVYVGYGQSSLWKSTDQGQTFKLVENASYTAMGVSPYSFDADPKGKRLVFWGMYGNSVMTLDGGNTWTIVAKHPQADFGATDWSDPEAKTMWVRPHGGLSSFSFDAGKNWSSPPEDKMSAFGVFDSKTLAGLLVDAVFLSTEGGANFTKRTKKVAPTAESCMRVYKGVGYWISPQGILVSKDKGATWEVQGIPLKNPIAGPYFGENEQHMVVVTGESFMETTDGGKSWTAAAPSLGDARWDNDKGETRGCRFFAWDWQHNIFYGAKLRSSAMKYVKPVPPLERKVVWDGDRTFLKSFGHAEPREKNAFQAQTDEVHQGKVALEFVIRNAPAENGKAVVRGGWNWHGWWPGDSGDDLSGSTHFVFWIKTEPGKKIDRFAAGLESSKPRERSPLVDIARYCPDAFDGNWHEVAIPVGDLAAEGSKFNPKLAWEFRIECQTDPVQVPYTLFFDDLSFDRRPAKSVDPVSADAPKTPAP